MVAGSIFFGSYICMREHPSTPADTDTVTETTDGLLWAFEKRPMVWDLEQLAAEHPNDFGFDSIKEAQETIKDFHAEADRRSRVVSLCDELVKMHLEDFFTRCAPSSTHEERAAVAGLVIVYMEVGRIDCVSSLINDIVKYGAAVALKKSVKVDSGKVFWHIAAAAWATVEVVVILLMIGAVGSGFQTLVISSLILIYAGLSFAIISAGKNSGLAAFGQSMDLKRIRFLLKDRLADTDQMHAEQDNLAKLIRKTDIRHNIFTVKVAVIELIGIIEILKTVLHG